MTTLFLSPLKKHQSGWEKKLPVHRMRYLDYLIIECSFVVANIFFVWTSFCIFFVNISVKADSLPAELPEKLWTSTQTQIASCWVPYSERSTLRSPWHHPLILFFSIPTYLGILITLGLLSKLQVITWCKLCNLVRRVSTLAVQMPLSLGSNEWKTRR